MFSNFNQLFIISSISFGLGIVIGRMFLSTPKKRKQTISQTDSELEYTSSSNFTEIQNFIISDSESEDVVEEEHSDSETEPIIEQKTFPDTQELSQDTHLDNSDGTNLDNGEDSVESVELNSNHLTENSDVVVDDSLEKQQNLEVDTENDKVGNFYRFNGDFLGPYYNFTVIHLRKRNEYFNTLEDAISNTEEHDIAIVEDKKGRFSIRRGICGTTDGISLRSLHKKTEYTCWIREDVINHPIYGRGISEKLGLEIE